MHWLDKDHYSVNELMGRWRVSLQDIGYFAERGFLEIQTWLSDVLITQYKLKKTEDGEIVPVQYCILMRTGYHIVDPDELRKVFRATSSAPVRKFISLDRRDVFSFQYKIEGIPISIEVLEVSKQERDRFEAENKIKTMPSPTNKTGILTTSVGRPSLMKLIKEQFKERAAMGTVETTLQAEARYLRSWAESEWHDVPPPALKTIANNLRQHFQSIKESGSRD